MESIIKLTVEALRNGKTILYPTDTIWGIGCDATNANAIEKIYTLKARDHSKSMLILCNNETMLRNYVPNIDPKALDIALNNERPTTVIFPQASQLPTNLLAADGSIGVRLPNMDFCQQVLLEFGKPIVSTSANLSGEPSPKCYDEISPLLKSKVDYCVPNLDSFKGNGTSSKIVKIANDGTIIILRP